MSLDIATYQLLDADHHIHFCSQSPDTKFLACALGNGVVCLVNAITFNAVARGAPGKDFLDVPATCIRWAPEQCDSAWQLVSSSCAGGVMLWHWDRNEFSLRRGAAACEKHNEVMVVDVSPSGKQVLTAGSDRIVRLYDSKLTPLAQLTEGVNADGTSRPAHTNRIFSLRFLTEVAAVSAGWESPIQLWDLRACRSNRQVVGVQGVSDCLEPVPSTPMVLVASPKSTNTLQIFDTVTGRVLEENSSKMCSQLNVAERVLVCRIQGDTGNAWCLTVSPPSVIVLCVSSGLIVARAALAHTPINMTMKDASVVVGCKNGVLLQVSLRM
ncbi:conserved hypothetical protein [Leishmania infantum JPCM5]|uniref:WD_domain_-_G-beta_repeat_-_putative n=2 Tax=Leishmania infantum TaxID=5671 RepID=A0A6L0XPK1_LEIIN|nr:conserved hypothetical protein [Leishmania infantum JPCM5]CAC9541942.1 WD_domain_-_G-beta_repeat_-_putative [Leishmania infantum]CAM71868.1 conserved hypothetical protein [Leishmania infantum JPCM5]SUZ45825.1 WD_domain_-_G-beta_repeat_-_putative [Leishmania infantum]|eukprot:XP_001468779.1 conserved hypothetical protein [Leishmania infantum JPCM5]